MLAAMACTEQQVKMEVCLTSQDVLNIKLRKGRLEEIWKKYEEIQDKLENRL
jgi:hypothetical protein